jgi:CPA2 family monovalent cation:H+ antiporter-2
VGQSSQHKKALVPIVAFTFPARAVVVVRTAGKSRDLQGGDATRKRLLEAAGLARARVIAITFDHHKALERVLHYARQENPNVATIVSAADDRDLPALVTAGVGTVFPENFAAGFGFADQVLLLSGFSQEDAADVVIAVRAELSPELSGHVGI